MILFFKSYREIIMIDSPIPPNQLDTMIRESFRRVLIDGIVERLVSNVPNISSSTIGFIKDSVDVLCSRVNANNLIDVYHNPNVIIRQIVGGLIFTDRYLDDILVNPKLHHTSAIRAVTSLGIGTNLHEIRVSLPITNPPLVRYIRSSNLTSDISFHENRITFHITIMDNFSEDTIGDLGIALRRMERIMNLLVTVSNEALIHNLNLPLMNRNLVDD